MRPASAYSTGGWFPDPVLSTMLGGGDDALPELANVILHESVHATVLVPDEPFFNESFATYVADALTDNWIELRFGPGSPEELAWTLGQALHCPRTARAARGVQGAQDAVRRRSSRARQKLAQKAKIIDELVADLKLRTRPNNASLTEARVYNGGAGPLLEAHRACGDLRSLIEAGKTLRRGDFGKTLQEDLDADRQAARGAVSRAHAPLTKTGSSAARRARFRRCARSPSRARSCSPPSPRSPRPAPAAAKPLRGRHAKRMHERMRPAHHDADRGQSIGAPWDGELRDAARSPTATAITSAGRRARTARGRRSTSSSA